MRRIPAWNNIQHTWQQLCHFFWFPNCYIYHKNFVSVRVPLQMCFNLICQLKHSQKNLKPCLLFHSEFVLAKFPSSQAETPPLRTKASQSDSINLSSSHKEMDKDANKPLSWHVMQLLGRTLCWASKWAIRPRLAVIGAAELKPLVVVVLQRFSDRPALSSCGGHTGADENPGQACKPWHISGGHTNRLVSCPAPSRSMVGAHLGTSTLNTGNLPARNPQVPVTALWPPCQNITIASRGFLPFL